MTAHGDCSGGEETPQKPEAPPGCPAPIYPRARARNDRVVEIEGKKSDTELRKNGKNGY